MNRGKFHQLLERVDDRYRGRPEALGRSMTRWIRFGMAILSAWLVGLFGLAAAVFAIGLLVGPGGGPVAVAIAVGILVYATTQAGLLLPPEAPPLDGRVLDLGEAPELAKLLDGLRRDLGCRNFDEVRVSLDFNAAVIERGRPGLLGRPRTVLEIGLPLLLILSTAEFRAVMAHEFIHLSARHGREGLRVQRLHRRWAELFARLHRSGGGTGLRATRWVASRFIDWYWPRLQARSLALSRHHEHQADRVAAAVAGAEHLAAALWQLQCRNPWLAERFWPDQRLGAAEAPEPPADAMDRLRRALLVPPAEADAARWTGRALSRRTLRDETHPAFFDRATALGVPEAEVRRLTFRSDPPAEVAAALLGPALDRVVREQSEAWRAGERLAWRDRHRRANLDARRRQVATAPAPAPAQAEGQAGAEPTPAAPPPGPADPAVPLLWLAARDVAHLRGPAAAAPQFVAILAREPAHPGAGVLLGQHLLGLGDPAGESLLWAVAAAGDEQWTPGACQVLEGHYRAAGRPDLQRQARDRLDAHEADVERARVERAEIGPGDRFGPHGLDPEVVEPLAALLRGRGDCVGAWLARKAVRHFPDRPVFVLAVRAAPRAWGLAHADRDAALVRDLVARVRLPGQVLVASRSGSFGRVARAVEAAPGTRIFPGDAADPAG